MRIHTLKCETCDASHPVVNPDMARIMPQGWLVLTAKQGYLSEQELHFCSTACLAQWAIKQAPVKVKDEGKKE